MIYGGSTNRGKAHYPALTCTLSRYQLHWKNTSFLTVFGNWGNDYANVCSMLTRLEQSINQLLFPFHLSASLYVSKHISLPLSPILLSTSTQHFSHLSYKLLHHSTIYTTQTILLDISSFLPFINSQSIYSNLIILPIHYLIGTHPLLLFTHHHFSKDTWSIFYISMTRNTGFKIYTLSINNFGKNVLFTG